MQNSTIKLFMNKSSSILQKSFYQVQIYVFVFPCDKYCMLVASMVENHITMQMKFPSDKFCPNLQNKLLSDQNRFLKNRPLMRSCYAMQFKYSTFFSPTQKVICFLIYNFSSFYNFSL